MKLAICGSRHFELGVGEVCSAINLVQSQANFPMNHKVVTGCARGVDEAARNYAKKIRGVNPIVFEADWETHGKAAGPIRNQQIIDTADALLLIWDGKSRGSADVRAKAVTKGIPIYEVIIPG